MIKAEQTSKLTVKRVNTLNAIPVVLTLLWWKWEPTAPTTSLYIFNFS